MADAADIKRWAECVLPEFAAELASFESSTHAAATSSTSGLHVLCDWVVKDSLQHVQSQVTPR